MNIALSIIALVIAIACLGVGIVFIFRVSALYGDMEKLAKWQGEVENSVKGFKKSVDDIKQNVEDLRLYVDEIEHQEVIYENLEGVVYDGETGTMNVKGNIKAEGWICAGTKGK